MYKVELSEEAQRFYGDCDKPIAKKLARCFDALEKNPREGNNVNRSKGSSLDLTAIALAIYASFIRSTIKLLPCL